MFYTAGYIQLYLREHLNESLILLVSDFSTEVTHNQSLRTCNFPLEDLIRFLKTPKDAKIYCIFKIVWIIGLYHMFRS